ncbi:outer membrane protein OmpA-like peptidoglycan-associated protein [Thiocapsa rosea]|uniref:Photosynthetic reaction center cytochrome c subunit n=1 Tax=Thiocapsa rosea TaxID=69360 RepID=A0A495VCX8_9GAMM|nr:outer membrane protein OmpA-like peptidoglycan-associated protein [Thiocapsa rosea]
MVTGLMVCSLLSLVGCDRTESVQWGERGTSMIHIDKPGRLMAAADIHSIPEPEPRDPPDPAIPLATEVNENIQVLTDLDALELARLMQAMSTWVAPKEGCEYCHNTENLASDEKYTKVVSRQMLQMTRDINSNWKSHVAGTGVTCWTCHRGQAVPSGTWFTNLGPTTPSAGITGVKAGQNTSGMRTVGNSSLPFDPLTPFFDGDAQVSVQGLTALPSDNRNSIKKAEWTYALMMYMSNSLGVNCTYCHQTRAMGVWEQSTPQRVTAWHGIRMVRELNGDYLNPLKTLYPTERLGPTGDAPKVACDTCHKGAFKPLLGVSMLGDYPELAGYRTERPGVVPEEPAVLALAEPGAESALIAALDDTQAPMQEDVAEVALEPALEPAVASDAGLAETERTALLQELESVRSQRDAAIAEAETEIAERDRRHAATLSQGEGDRAAADARLQQERIALQQQLAVVRGQRDAVAADSQMQAAKLTAERAAALRAAGARLDQERTALQQQLAVVRAQRHAVAAEAELQIAKLGEERAAALRAAGARLDQERTALQQQLAVVRGQRDSVSAEAQGQLAKLSDERAAVLRAAGARLDQERTALQQQLAVVRGQRDAVAAEAERQIAKLDEERAAALRAAGARLDQERVALQQQLGVVRAQRDAALADTESESQIAALTEEMDALRAMLAESDAAAADLRARKQAAATEHAHELAEAKESITRLRTLYEGAAEVGGRITPEGIVVNLGGEELRFPSGSAVLPAGALPMLDRIAEMLAARSDLKAKIAGHTDSLGNPEINQALSRQRAESVMQALIERGVDPGRLSTEGYGAERPIADNATDRGRRENRRVEIVMIEQTGNDAVSNLTDS